MNFIPLFCAGGIGDLIISIAWIESVIRPLNIPVHFYSNFPEIALYFLPWLKSSKDLHIGAREKINFDFFISISDMIFFERLNDKALPSYVLPIFEAFSSHRSEWEFYLKNHPHQANPMAKKALELNQTRWTLPFYFSNKEYQPYIVKQEIKDIQIPERFITIHDGFDASGFYKFDRSTKSWSIQSWEEFVSLFKKRFPDIYVIQLGGMKHQKIKGVHINFAGQLEFKKSLQYLKSSLVHIDGDSGLVHARHLFNKKSIVIFGSTNPKYFGYAENINIPPSFCGDCWWNHREWMAKCMKGYSTPKCIDSISPQHIFKIIENMI